MVSAELLNDRSWSSKIASEELQLHFLATRVGHSHYVHELTGVPLLRETGVETGVATVWRRVRIRCGDRYTDRYLREAES